MERPSTEAIVKALQELEMATYGSLRLFDRTYSSDTYKNGLKSLEAKGQVKKIVFHVGKSPHHVWLLPWYEDDVNEKIREFENSAVKHLETSPATARQIRDYFKELFPSHHYVAYLAFHKLVRDGLIGRLTFNDQGSAMALYFLPEKKSVLDDLLLRSLDHVRHSKVVFSKDLSDSLMISRSLAFTLLSYLAHQNTISKLKVGWNYLRNKPAFAFCQKGYEREAVARYKKMLAKGNKESRHRAVLEHYRPKFEAACREMNANPSLVDLASGYLERVMKSQWTKGREVRVAAWTGLLIACKTLREGITAGEIERHAGVGRGKLLACSKELTELLKLDVPGLYPDPNDYVERIVSNMMVYEPIRDRLRTNHTEGHVTEQELLNETKKVISSLPRTKVFGKRPESIAAAALYLTSRTLGIEEVTQELVSVASDITQVTLRNILKVICENGTNFRRKEIR
jgi:transcription initiation factor TFIIIB Brf1 subunit/transcription initiation factor TFIIB